MLKTTRTMWMMVIALPVTMTATVRRLMVWTRMRYSRRRLEWFELGRQKNSEPSSADSSIVVLLLKKQNNEAQR
jgi:hypothetical protein